MSGPLWVDSCVANPRGLILKRSRVAWVAYPIVIVVPSIEAMDTAMRIKNAARPSPGLTLSLAVSPLARVNAQDGRGFSRGIGNATEDGNMSKNLCPPHGGHPLSSPRLKPGASRGHSVTTLERLLLLIGLVFVGWGLRTSHWLLSTVMLFVVVALGFLLHIAQSTETDSRD